MNQEHIFKKAYPLVTFNQQKVKPIPLKYKKNPVIKNNQKECRFNKKPQTTRKRASMLKIANQRSKWKLKLP
jgi:hypothetical protein